MKTRVVCLLSSILALSACGGGAPDDMPDGLAVFWGIDGHIKSGRGCVVTSDELESFFTRKRDCYSILGGDGEARSMPLVDGKSAFEYEYVRDYFVADASIGAMPTYDESRVGHSRKVYQLVSRKGGDVANPFTTIEMLSGQNIGEISSALGLSDSSILSSNYLEYISAGPSHSFYEDSLFAQAVGRGIISILPESLSASMANGSDWYKDRLDELISEALHAKGYYYGERLRELSFVLLNDHDGLAVRSVQIPNTFEVALRYPEGNGEWLVVDFADNWALASVSGSSEGVLAIDSKRGYGEYGYSVNDFQNLVIDELDLNERFFYGSREMIFSDVLIDDYRRGATNTFRMWVSDASLFEVGESVNESDFEGGATYYLLSASSTGTAYLNEVVFDDSFSDKYLTSDGGSLQICEYRESNPTSTRHILEFSGDIDSRAEFMSMRTRCGLSNNSPSLEGNKITFVTGGGLHEGEMVPVARNEEVLVLRDLSTGVIFLLVGDESLAKHLHLRWRFEQLQSDYQIID